MKQFKVANANIPEDAQVIEVYDDEGPREAAEAFAADRAWRSDHTVIVSAGGGAAPTRWRVEPVTTYRARLP